MSSRRHGKSGLPQTVGQRHKPLHSDVPNPSSAAPTAGLGRADWIGAGILLAATLVIFWQGWYDPVDMVHEDAAYFLQPYFQFAADEVRSGRFPHWNPFAMCGTPFHATLNGAVLYPLRWPMFWMSWPVAYAFGLWIHFFLTGLFTHLLLRTTLQCGPAPSLVGALSFTFGGFTMGHLSNPYFLAYPWFVLTVLLLSRCIVQRRWAWAVAASIPIGLIATTGQVQLLLILGFGLGVWGLGELIAGMARGIRSDRPAWVEAIRPGLAISIAVLLGGALGAAQILPAFAQMGLSTRAGVGYEFITDISAHPIRMLIRLAAPFYWGNYRLGYWGENSFHEQCFYAGMIPLVAAITIVLVAPRDRWVARFGILCVVTLLVAAGRFLPFYWLLYKFVPMFDRLRDPARLFCWFQFGVACLGAIGLDRLCRPDTQESRRKVAVASGMACLAVALVMAGCLVRLSLLARDPSPAIEYVKQLPNLNPAERAEHLHAAEHMPGAVMDRGDAATWLGIIAAVSCCIALWTVLTRSRRLTWTTAAILTALLVLDLGMLSAGMMHYSNKDRVITKRPEHVRFLQERLGPQRYLCLQGRDADVSLHRGMFFRIRHAIAGGGGILHTPRQEQMLTLLWRGNMRLLNLAGVRYIVADRPIKTAVLRPVFQDVGGCISENTQALPRAFLTRQTRTISDPNALLNEILMGKSDLTDVAFVEQSIEPLPTTQAADAPRGEVLDLKADVSRYTMRTRAPAPRQLVLTETDHPEWRCAIDGQPAPIHRTDWTFMSVRVPAGEHTVEWWYEPSRFRTGLMITLVSLTVVAGLLGVEQVRRAVARGRAGH